MKKRREADIVKHIKEQHDSKGLVKKIALKPREPGNYEYKCDIFLGKVMSTVVLASRDKQGKLLKQTLIRIPLTSRIKIDYQDCDHPDS